MQKNEKIYLDRKGYNDYLKEIDELEQKLIDVGKDRTVACQDGATYGWPDNFGYEDANREERRIMGRLIEERRDLARIVIVDSHDENDELVDINDYVTVVIKFSLEDAEEMVFKLVATSNLKFDVEIPEFSINSPLGKAVYQKKIGEQVSYMINGVNVLVNIKNKTKELEEKQEDNKTYVKRKEKNM